MKDLQEDAINKILNRVNIVTNKITKNKMQIDNENITNKIYEVQYIIQHKELDNGIYEYEVKWRNSNKKYNSWVHEKDFDSKEIINDYWDTLGYTLA